MVPIFKTYASHNGSFPQIYGRKAPPRLSLSLSLSQHRLDCCFPFFLCCACATPLTKRWLEEDPFPFEMAQVWGDMLLLRGVPVPVPSDSFLVN